MERGWNPLGWWSGIETLRLGWLLPALGCVLEMEWLFLPLAQVWSCTGSERAEGWERMHCCLCRLLGCLSGPVPDPRLRVV